MQKIKDTVNVIYTDTDSIIIERKDLQKLVELDLIHPTTMGKFKIVEEAEEGIFIAPKTYLLKSGENYTRVLKGINLKDLEGKITDQELHDIFKKKLIENSEAELTIKRHNYFQKNTKTLQMSEKEQILTFSLNFNKRKKIYKNGI